jgi:hypothetical protein
MALFGSSSDKIKKKDEEDEEEEEEEEDEEDKKRKDWKNTDGWVSFVKTLAIYFLITMIVGLVGSSFIYLTTRGSELDKIFPTDDRFYTAKQYKTQKSGASNVVDCNETSTGTFSVFENNFPYNLIEIDGTPSKEQLKELSLVTRLTNWFAKCVAGCFKSNRGMLKGYLDSFAPQGPLGNHVFQIYIAAPFTLFVIGFASLFTGYFSALGSGISSDFKVTLFGFFLMYSFGLFGGLAGVIFLRLIGTLLFFPMSQDWKEVANIMACNVKPLVVLFGFFVCGVAYDTLDKTIAGVMGVVYLCLVVYSLWKYFTKQLF